MFSLQEEVWGVPEIMRVNANNSFVSILAREKDSAGQRNFLKRKFWVAST
jgi:hypothetical protein